MTNKDKDSFSSRIKTNLSKNNDSLPQNKLDQLSHLSSSEVTDSTFVDTPVSEQTKRQRREITKREIKNFDTNRYETLEEIGSGGFGRVYKSFDAKLSREVALKTIRFDKQIAKEVEIFEHEARTLAQCNHPNIVQIYDVQKYGENPYIVMEFINGPNICDYVNMLKKTKSIDQWQRIVCSHIVDLVDALNYIHKRNIYHQDLKPKNILISLNNSSIKLVDFGLAADCFDRQKNIGLSGTYGYIPPEKFTGKGSSQLHDIYALGAVLFEVLTGRLAHPGKTMKEVASHVVHQSVKFFAEDMIDNKLQEICRKCLEKDPQKRYQNCQDIYSDLRKYLGNKTTVNDYPYLSLVTGKKKLVFPLTGSSNFIGRTFSNQIVIPDPSISRSQAVIEINENVKIKNLSEVNKIRVGDVELGYEQKIKLMGHETIHIADYTFHYIPRSEIQSTEEIIVEVEGRDSKIVNRVVAPISASQKQAQEIGLTYSQIDNSIWETTIATPQQNKLASAVSSLSKSLNPSPKTASMSDQDAQELHSYIADLKNTIKKLEAKIPKK